MPLFLSLRYIGPRGALYASLHITMEVSIMCENVKYELPARKEDVTAQQHLEFPRGGTVGLVRSRLGLS